MPSVDVDWHIGVCGWQDHTGRHVRLTDLTAAHPDQADALIERHRDAAALLSLVLAKLTDELREATTTRPPGGAHDA